MMNKLIVLVLALAIAAPALADDMVAPSWRGDPGSTYSEWTYDDPCDVYDGDFPEISSFVGGLLNLDNSPAGDPCSWGDPTFSAQWWGSNDSDPCAPTPPWIPGAFGRTGLVDFAFGSWDLNNFVDDLPAKDMWVQITYYAGGGPAEIEWMEAGYPGPPDPCGPSAWGWWEGLTDPEDPCSFAYFEGPLAEWETWAGDPLETWMDDGGGEQYVEDWTLESSQPLGDGWIHDVFSATLPTNPDWEYFAFGTVENILIDQIIIETISYVPEPATMVLLGLGSLMMIRRKKRQGS